MVRYIPRSTEELIRWYERYVSPLSLVAGFILDNFVFRQVDLLVSSLALAVYLGVAAVGIVVINLIETGRWKSRFILPFAPFISVAVQFAFGGLFSGFVILYSQSAALAVSWIFVVALAALMIGNERFRKRYLEFSFQISVFFIALFSFFILFLPIVFNQVSQWMFFGSAVVSAATLALFMWVLAGFFPELVRKEGGRIAWNTGGILVIFIALYMVNAIPPLPLALKEGAIYHSVVKTPTGYLVEQEHLPWYQRYLRYNPVFHKKSGDSAYVFTAIFAPAQLSTNIVHEWQYYDKNEDAWVTKDTIEFPILGGRDEGYRGYTLRKNPEEGKWRVNVETSYGQLIGRVAFTVVLAEGAVVLEEKTR